MAHKKPATAKGQIVTLADLAPRNDVTGGSQRRVFGSEPIGPVVENGRGDMKTSKAAKKAKDLPPKSGIKGGGHNLNDNLTLVRAAKPTPKKKDLPSRKDVKGGKLSANDNITLVRETQ
jgi:hypothetical protein